MPTRVKSSSFSNTGSLTIWTVSLVVDTASGNDRALAIIMQGSGSNAEAISTVTLDSVSCSELGQLADDGGRGACAGVYFINDASMPSAAGTYDLEITFTGSVAYNDLVVEEWSGVSDQTTPFKHYAGRTDTGVTPSTPLTPATFQDITLTGASGDIGYTVCVLTGGNTTSTTVVPTNTDITAFQSPSGRGQLNVAIDDSVASAAEAYGWDVNQGTDPIQTMLLMAFSVDASVVLGPTITSATPNDADNLTTLTTSAPYSSPVSSVTYNSAGLADVVEATATTVTVTMPRGGQAFGSSNDFQVTDSLGAGNLFSATFNPPTGYGYVVATGNDAEGIFPDGMVAGDHLAYELTTSGAHSVSVGSTGLVTYGIGTLPGETFPAYPLDSNDGYSAGDDFTVTVTNPEISGLVATSKSNSLDPAIQISGSLDVPAGVGLSKSNALDASIVLADQLTVLSEVATSSSGSLDPSIQLSASLVISADLSTSKSNSTDPAISLSAQLDVAAGLPSSKSNSLAPGIQIGGSVSVVAESPRSISSSIDPVVNLTALLNVVADVSTSNSAANDPAISYSSSVVVLADAARSTSRSVNPSVILADTLVVSADTPRSISNSLAPLVQIGVAVRIGSYTLNYKDSGISLAYAN